MTCLGCARCEDGPVVTLMDGRVVCDHCDDWRAECEARAVCDMPSISARRDYLEKVATKRGEAAVKVLKSDIARLWAVRRLKPE